MHRADGMTPSLSSARAVILLSLASFGFAFGCTTTNPDDGGTDPSDGGLPDVDVPQCNPSACASHQCAPSGDCAPTCNSDSDCASGETCCNSAYCSDLAKDPQNCGACGVACSAQQFCSGSACADAVVKNVCANAHATTVFDELDADDDAGARVGSAIVANCGSIQLDSVTQGASGTMDPSSGRPLTGPGDTYVAAGGEFGQKAVAYMNATRDAPVFTVADGTSASFVRTSDGSTIVQAAVSNLTAHHDYFVIYAAAEPVSGTLVFAVYGFYAPGTAAGAYWFQSQPASAFSSMTKQYYVYEWTDTNNDGAPNAADTFTLLASN